MLRDIGLSEEEVSRRGLRRYFRGQ
ncbi:MAG: hypothetical protein AB7F09_00710 [Parvibaculaceae bacterium]